MATGCPPLLPLLAAGAVVCLWPRPAVVLAPLLVAWAAHETWHWWRRLVITIDGVPYKERSASGRPTGPRHGFASPPCRARCSATSQEGFMTPPSHVGGDRGVEAECPDAAAATMGSVHVGTGFTEWAPFAPSLPFGEHNAAAVAGAAATSSDAPPPCWGECDASLFDVRNVRYKQTKEKVPSESAMYDCVGMDMIRDKRRIDALVDKFPEGAGLPASPPDAPEWTPAWGVPRVLVVNCQLPYRAGYLFTSHPQDDGGLSVAAYFVLGRQASELLEHGTPTPSLRLLQRFVEGGTTTKEGISFKAVGRVEDLDRYEVPESFHRFNNKPVLLTKSATVVQSRLPEVLELDYDVRSWVYLARSALATYHPRARDAEFEIGYLVEGKMDGELPEQILGCFKLLGMDITQARWVSLM